MGEKVQIHLVCIILVFKKEKIKLGRLKEVCVQYVEGFSFCTKNNVNWEVSVSTLYHLYIMCHLSCLLEFSDVVFFLVLYAPGFSLLRFKNEANFLRGKLYSSYYFYYYYLNVIMTCALIKIRKVYYFLKKVK